MLDEWNGNAIRWLAQIEIVDVRSRQETQAAWREFISSKHQHNYSILTDVFGTQVFKYVRRSCDALAMATLQQEPFSENPFPRTGNLQDLHNWMRPLVREEQIKHFPGARTPTGQPSS